MVGSTPRLVIGRMDDIKYLYRAEYTLPGQNRLPNLGNPKANWIQNSMEEGQFVMHRYQILHQLQQNYFRRELFDKPLLVQNVIL